MDINSKLGAWAEDTTPITVMAKEFKVGHHVPSHYHDYGQLVYATKGLMELRAANECWMIPTCCGLWIPPYIKHEMITRTNVSLRSLFIDVEKSQFLLPEKPAGIDISPLLKELIIRASTLSVGYSSKSFEDRIMTLTIEEIHQSIEKGLSIPLGMDKRLRRICLELLKDPGNKRSLKQWGDLVGATSRTLARLFLKETGMPFSDWRIKLRITDAIMKLADGESIISVSESLGYSSQSSFTAMFKRVTGKLPTYYIHR